MRGIVAPIGTAGLSAGQKDGQAAAAFLRRVVENVERQVSSNDPCPAPSSGASLPATKASSRLGFHLNTVRKMLEMKDRRSPLPTGGRALLSLAEVYQALGDNAAALRIFQRWLQRNDARREPAMRSHVQLQLGSIYADLGEWAAATQAIDEGLATLTTLRDHAGIISGYIVLGKIAYKQGKYLQARGRFEQGLHLAEESNDVRHIGATKMQLGVIARMQGRSNYALACFQDALIQFQSAQDDAATAECLSHLGVLHLQNRRLREASGCVDKSIGLCRDNGWALVLAYAYLNKAAVHIEEGDHVLAASTCGKGLELMSLLHNMPGLAKVARLCAQILAVVGPRAAARGFLEISMELYEKFSIPLGLANCYLDMAQLFQTENESVQAATYLARAQEILRTLDLPTSLQSRRQSLFRKNYQSNSFTLEET